MHCARQAGAGDEVQYAEVDGETLARSKTFASSSSTTRCVPSAAEPSLRERLCSPGAVIEVNGGMHPATTTSVCTEPAGPPLVGVTVPPSQLFVVSVTGLHADPVDRCTARVLHDAAEPTAALERRVEAGLRRAVGDGHARGVACLTMPPDDHQPVMSRSDGSERKSRNWMRYTSDGTGKRVRAGTVGLGAEPLPRVCDRGNADVGDRTRWAGRRSRTVCRP